VDFFDPNNAPEIGFVGAGNMGSAMARNLLAKGFSVRVFDREFEKSEQLTEHGATVAGGLTEVTPKDGVVISMVDTDDALEQIALSPGGILDSIGNGVHLSTSTVAPETSERLEERYRSAGATFLAGTVLGRPDVAQRAQLTVFLAGDDAGKARVQPLLDAVGRRTYDVGKNAAAANVVKVGANLLIMAAIEAMAEAAAMVEGHGVDRALFLNMIVESPLFGGAVYEGYGAMIGEQRYRPALFPVALGLKDARLAKQVAEAVGVDPASASLVERNLLLARERGYEHEDWSVIGRVLSTLPGKD
jgi:3-hydroxyisobutyrate dehydrogenase-like beta-hydroxyacid dehydrogenase